MEPMNRKGLTAIADAMVFIVLITLAFTVICTMSVEKDGPEVQNASEILDILLDSDTVADIGDGPVGMKIYKGLVYSMYADCGTDREVTGILDSHFMRNDSYRLTVEQGGNTFSLGSGAGTPVSACTRELTAPYFTAVYTLEIF